MFIKQSTAQYITLGAFVAEDGKTIQTGLTIATADVILHKAGAAGVAKVSTTATVHAGNGFYRVHLSTADTDTAGELVISVKLAGSLVCWKQLTVYPAAIFNAMISGSTADGAGIPANLTAIRGNPIHDGTATLNLKQLQLQGYSGQPGFLSNGVAITNPSASQPALSVVSSSDIPAALITTANATAISISSLSKGISIHGNTHGVEITSSNSSEPALKVYNPNGNAVLFMAGKTALALKNTGVATSGNAGENCGLLVEAQDGAGGYMGCGIKIQPYAGIGNLYTGIASRAAGSGSSGITLSAENGAFIAGTEYGVSVAAENSQALRLFSANSDAAKFDGGGCGLYLKTRATVSGHKMGLRCEASSLSARAAEFFNGVGDAVGMRGKTGGLYLQTDSNAAFNVYSDTGTAALFNGSTYGMRSITRGTGGIGFQVTGDTTDISARELVAIKASADYAAEKVGIIYLRLPAVGLIAGQMDIQVIQNNTTFVTTIPDTAVVPSTGFRAYRVRCLVYNTAGTMENPDNGVAVRISNAGGTSRNSRLYTDAACTVAAVAHTDYSGFVRVPQVGSEIGVFELYYKNSAGDTLETLQCDFSYKENNAPHTYARQTTLVSEAPGSAALADTPANLEVIAKAVRGYAPVVSLATGSIQQSIESNVSTVGTKVTAMTTTVNTIATTTADTNADLEALDAWIRANIVTDSELSAAVSSINSNVDSCETAVLAAVAANAVEIAKIVAKLPTTGKISNLYLTTAAGDGTTLEEAIETIRAGIRGRFRKDGSTLTFFKADGNECFKVSVSSNERLPLA